MKLYQRKKQNNYILHFITYIIKYNIIFYIILLNVLVFLVKQLVDSVQKQNY
jgi:hypothetical protein